ncbi:MAG TPA: aspartate aminotransferase family protein [Aquihabitans sp.]|nr:aspartate aminotransferase family protein [Aquihabitans sp.]
MTTHEELLARHRRVLPDWLTLNYEQPIALVDGAGCHVVDAEGTRYLDLFGGILTTMCGYAVPEVVDAIRTQAGRMLHTSTLYLIEPMIELAERIAGLSTIPDAKVFFTTSGTEANEAALLVASSHRRSNQVLALRNSYHGRSFATMGMTGNRGWSPSSLSPFVVHYVQNGYRFRSPFGHLDDAGFTAAVVDDLRDVLATCTAGDVAAMVIEPIQGVGGFTVPPDGMWGEVQQVLREHGILYVSDEVQTGWGRTGEHFWGFQAHGVEPDLITFAKGVGNGLPVAGVIGRGELMEAVSANSISTFGGNPLVAAGALANLEYLLDHDLQANAAEQGKRIRAVLDPLVDRVPAVGDVRGKGLMIGVELVGADGRTPAPDAAAEVLEETRRRGVLIGKGGLHGNCLRIAPPLSISAEEAEHGASVVAAALEGLDAA